MRLQPHLLDHWLQKADIPGASIRWDLGSSTGPRLTLREFFELAGDGVTLEDLGGTSLSYSTAEGLPELRRMISELEGVTPDDVLVTTGASEAILIIMALAAEPGANVVLPFPDFPAISSVAAAHGLDVRRYHLDRASGFALDPERVTALVDAKTKLVMTISPHNPTGTVVDWNALRHVHDFCVARGVQLVCDQVYHPIYHGPAVHSGAKLPGATVVGGFSKSLCLSGLRLGWIVERNAMLREQFLNARMHVTISNAILSETLGVIALRHRDRILDRAQATASRNLMLLDGFFRDHADRFEWVRPQGGLTCFPWLRNGEDATPVCSLAERSGVLIVPGSCFGAPNHFRLGFGANSETFERGLERLVAAIC